ncbi:methyltransferase [Salinirubellus sp. GCM10025818]|uniref:methyltransferase n=1 Tax=Salinirubellus TaxID=2162630 RepID=UPI0030D0F5E0
MAETTSDEREHTPEESEPDPEHIMQVATGFWGTKVLGAAVDLELFTVLADGGLRASEIERKLDLHPRATRDFLDTLASLGFLERDGDGDDPRYRNTPETAAFLNKNDPRYIGGAIDIFNQQTYDVWGGLEESLRTGEPQGVIDETGEPLWEEMYDDPMELEAFAEGMAGLSKGNFVAFAKQFDFSDYDSMTDVGGALGDLSRIVARREPHLSITTTDLPEVAELAHERIQADGLEDRIDAVSSDYNEEPIPDADLVTASLVLHQENLETKKTLMEKFYDAVNPGGTFVAIDHIIDDDRQANTMGLMMSLNMLVYYGDAFDYTGEQFVSWAEDAGFEDVQIQHLNGPASMGIAHKR